MAAAIILEHEQAEAEARIVTGEDIRVDQEDERYKYPEVLFPRFTHQTPWGDPTFYQGQQGTTTIDIRIKRLCHITHNAEADNIKGENEFNFIPRPKLGKRLVWDGSPRGTTYREIANDQYREIPHLQDNLVFPGYLSWWGIDTREWLDTRPDIKSLVKDNKDIHKCYPPDYLSDPPKSLYGNKVFSFTLENILEDYVRSRPDRPDKRACLRGCGTLRYQHEICYVIMICMKGDDVQNDTFNLPPVNPNHIINLNDMVDPGGVILDYAGTPIFTPQSIVTWHRGISYDWENLAFCFYFPPPPPQAQVSQLIIRVEPNTTPDIIEHNQETCPAKRRDANRSGGKKCPNEHGLSKIYH